MDCRHQLGQGRGREALASCDDAGGGIVRTGAVAGHGNKQRDGLAVARGGYTLAALDVIQQAGQVCPGLGSADPFHREPQFSLGQAI